MDVSHKIFAALVGRDPDTYPVSGVDVRELGYVDLVGYVKDSDISQMLKSIHAKKMKVTDFTFTYGVDADSTEDYTVMGSEKRYLANEVAVESGYLAASAFTLAHTPKTLKNGDKLLSCIVSGIWLVEDEDYTVSGTTVTVSGGGTNTIIALYHTSANYTTWTDVTDNTIPPAIRGKDVPVEIGANGINGIQSVTIRGTMPSTTIKEMGNHQVVGYITDPAEITGDITVLDTDNQLISLLTTGSKTDLDGYGEYGVDEYAERTLSLEIKLKDPADHVTIKKVIYIPKVRITSDGTSTNVGGQLTQTFSFSSEDSQCIVYSGARPA